MEVTSQLLIFQHWIVEQAQTAACLCGSAFLDGLKDREALEKARPNLDAFPVLQAQSVAMMHLYVRSEDEFVIDPDQEAGFNRFEDSLFRANSADSNVKAYLGW